MSKNKGKCRLCLNDNVTFNFYLTPIYIDNVVQLVVGQAMFFFITKLPSTIHLDNCKDLLLGEKLTLTMNVPSKIIFHLLGFKNYDPLL